MKKYRNKKEERLARGIKFKGFCLRLKEGGNSSSAKSTTNYKIIIAKYFVTNSVHSPSPVKAASCSFLSVVKQTRLTASTYIICVNHLLLLKAERLMEAIELYKEETAKMEEQGGAHQKVLMM